MAASIRPLSEAHGRRELEHVQRDARVAVRVSGDAVERVVVRGQAEIAEPAFPIRQRAPENARPRSPARAA